MSNNAQNQVSQSFEPVQPIAKVVQHPRAMQASTSETVSNPSSATFVPYAAPDATDPPKAAVYPLSLATVAEMLTAELEFTCNVNTLKSRWLPDKILPTYQGLKCPPLKSPEGKVTEFGYQQIRNFIAACIVGKNGQKIAPEAYREELEQRFEVMQIVDPLNRINELRAKIQQRRSENEQEITALATRQNDTQARSEAIQEGTKELAEVLEQERQKAEQERKESEDREELEMRERILAKLLKEKAIEAELRQQLGMGK